MTRLSTCRLTEPLLEQFASATRGMLAALADPAVRRQAERLEDDAATTADGVRSVAAIAARFDRVEALRDAIGGAGMTTRSYVVVQLALFQATMRLAYLESEEGATTADLPEGVVRENVEFVQANRARISRLVVEMRALTGSGDAAGAPVGDAPDAAFGQPATQEPGAP